MALPISAQSIERAIELNGVAVDANLQAFRRGRQAVAEPNALAALAAGLHRPAGTATAGRHVPSPAAERLLTHLDADASDELRDVVALRVDELIGYQDEAYAAVHGGLWRLPYAPRSVLGLAALVGATRR